MRKQFKKGVAILSAVSMVAAGISYVPQNVKADAPVIAVQDSEEGVALWPSPPPRWISSCPAIWN